MDTKTLKKLIGKNLQSARKNAGYKSSNSFADAVNMNRTAYVEYEQGRAALPTYRAWEFADFLGISIDELVGHEVAERITYSDPAQQALNGYFESMNDVGRGALVETARLMSDGDAVRIEKDRAENVDLPTTVEKTA